MRLGLSPARRWLVVTAAVLAVAVLTGTASCGVPGRRRARAPGGPACRSHRASQANAQPGQATPGEFTTTANPVTLDPPVRVPASRPGRGHDRRPRRVRQQAAPGHRHGHAAPRRVGAGGARRDRHRDRTPVRPAVRDLRRRGADLPRRDPRADPGRHHLARAEGHHRVPPGAERHPHVLHLRGQLPVRRRHPGSPVITARLLFYPAAGGAAPPRGRPAWPRPRWPATRSTRPGPPRQAQHPGVPTQVVPVLPAGASNTLSTVSAGQTVSATVSLPGNVTTATLDLYAVGQGTDEFWWSLGPAFRGIEVSIDGKPAGVVWPYPYVYTGGVNPLIWRPVTGIHTMDIPSYRLDLTPFAGMLAGTHTVSLTVAGNAGVLAGGRQPAGHRGRRAHVGRPSSPTPCPSPPPRRSPASRRAGLGQPAGDQQVPGLGQLRHLRPGHPGRPHLDRHAAPVAAVRRRPVRHQPVLLRPVLPVGPRRGDPVGRADRIGPGRERDPPRQLKLDHRRPERLPDQRRRLRLLPARRGQPATDRRRRAGRQARTRLPGPASRRASSATGRWRRTTAPPRSPTATPRARSRPRTPAAVPTSARWWPAAG